LQGAGRATARALRLPQELAQSPRTLAARTERLLMEQRAATFLHN